MSINIPSKCNYFEVYLTFRCNFHCLYCINNHSGINRRITELSAQQWVDSLNKIDFHIPLTFGGGEPSLHPEFYDILRGIKDSVSVDLLSNLRFDVDEFKKQTTPKRFNHTNNPAYKSIRVSYHPKQTRPIELLEKAQDLQDAGFQIGIFGINHPENMDYNIEMAELARQHKVYFFIKDFLGEYQGTVFGFYKYPDGLNKEKRKVKCRSTEILVSPEGYVYKCHRDLYAREVPIASIEDPNLKFSYRYRDCFNFGDCNPCDLKIKANRFLQMGNCSVDIC